MTDETQLTDGVSLKPCHSDLGLSFPVFRTKFGRAAIFEADETPVVTMETTPVRRMPYWRIAAAAVVLLIVTAAGLLWMNHYSKNQVSKVDIKNDVAPGGNKAVLTLANGNTIILDNAANGTLANEGNSKVVKTSNGQLVYTVPGGNASVAIINRSLLFLNLAKPISN